MDSLVAIFLNHIAEEIFVDNALTQEDIFKYRFNPKYEKYPHSYKQNESDDELNIKAKEKKGIADLIQLELGIKCQYSIHQELGEVIQKVYKTYQKEMEQNGITQEQIKGKRGGGGGKNAPWRVVYRWLWNSKYPRWSQDYIWDSWKNRAENSRDWIQFSDREDEYAAKAMVIPAPKPKETLPINTPLNLAINLNRPGNYILLLNRGRDKKEDKVTKYLVAPSQAFAPSYELESKVTLVPQKDSMMHEYGIKFDAESEEEYLGIVIEDPLDLPWLKPDPENPVLEWKGEHLNELWDKLHRQGNWQVFYRDFKVVA